MNRYPKPEVWLWISAGLVLGEALAQVVLPPFRAWELPIVIFSGLISWGLLRASRAAWRVAALGSLAQLAVGLVSGPSVWPVLGGVALLSCLLSSPVRRIVFQRVPRRPRTASADVGTSLPNRISELPLQAGMQVEEFLAKVDRRLVIRGAIVAACLFLGVGVVGSWHGKLKHQTAATETVWTVVVTTYKVALIGLVALVLMAVIGASLRKRQGADSKGQ